MVLATGRVIGSARRKTSSAGRNPFRRNGQDFPFLWKMRCRNLGALLATGRILQAATVAVVLANKQIVAEDD